MTPFGDAALRYLELGFHPIPVEPRGKKPLIGWKEYQDQQPKREEVQAWWACWPEANVALVLGRGMFAIDVDGLEGAQSWLSTPDMAVPEGTPTSNTGRGRHYFLSAPGHVGDHIGLLPGIDIRGVGYVVVPPSIHATGREYTWDIPLLEKPPLAPDAVLALMQPAKNPERETTWVQQGTEWLLTALQPTPEGKRDSTCLSLAGYFFRKGVPPAAVQAIMESWADRCKPPFSYREVKKCVESACSTSRVTPPAAPLPLHEHLKATMSKIGKPEALRATGLPALDELLGGGFQPGEFILLGGRPGLGKTTIALQWTRNIALQGYGCLFLSLEMTPGALTRRMLAQESGISATTLRSGKPTDSEWQQLNEAMSRLHSLPIIISNDVVGVEQLQDALNGYESGRVQMLVVDYLQLVRGPKGSGGDRRHEVEAVSAVLKSIALSRQIPVLALSSLSRPPRDVNEYKYQPGLSDLRESGTLEHDGDVVLLMSKLAEVGGLKLTVAKNRDGATGELYLGLDESLRLA